MLTIEDEIIWTWLKSPYKGFIGNLNGLRISRNSHLFRADQMIEGGHQYSPLMDAVIAAKVHLYDKLESTVTNRSSVFWRPYDARL